MTGFKSIGGTPQIEKSANNASFAIPQCPIKPDIKNMILYESKKSYVIVFKG